MVVQHNLSAMNASRQFGITRKNKAKTAEKLASGYRINRTADDAAGLAISEKMRMQIRGLTQGTANIQDGISFVQVADGALDEVTGLLQRINELSVKAANGTLDGKDREYIDREVQELKKEIDRIYTTTTFNEQKIWDDTQLVVDTIQVEDQNRDEYPAVVFNVIPSNTAYVNNDNKLAMPYTTPAFTASDDGLVVSWTGYNGTKYTSNLIPWEEPITGTHSFTLSDYMDYGKYPDARDVNYTYTYTVNEYSTKDQVIAAFKESRANVSKSNSASVKTNMALEGLSNVAHVSAGASINYDAMLASGKNFGNFDTSFIEFVSMNNPALPDISDSSKISFTFDMPNIGLVNATVSRASYTGWYDGDLSNRDGEGVWWDERKYSSGEKYKSTKTYSIDGSMDGIISGITNNTAAPSLWEDNDKSVYFTISFNLTSANPYTLANSVGTSSNVGSLSLSFTINKNAAATRDELVDYVRRTIANIKSIDIEDPDTSSYMESFRIYRTSNTNSSTKAYHDYVTYHDEYVYTTMDGKDVYIQSGTERDHGLHIIYDNANIKLLGLESTNTVSQGSALKAIDQVKSALTKVSGQRSLFGAYQNRLEHSLQSNKNVVENTTASESRIRDTEMDKEVVRDSMLNILSQAGVSMMAQANQSNQMVLSLLQ